MSRTRTVALLLLAAGCGKPDAPPTSPTARPTAPAPSATAPVIGVAGVGPGGVPPPAAVVAPADLPAVTAAATKLLAGLAAGTAEATAVAPEFQTTLAGGDAGKASWATEQYLRGFAGKVSAQPPTVAPLADGSVLAVAPPTPTAGRVVVRLAKAGDAWRAVWLHQGPTGPVPELTGDPATLSVRFAVAA